MRATAKLASPARAARRYGFGLVWSVSARCETGGVFFLKVANAAQTRNNAKQTSSTAAIRRIRAKMDAACPTMIARYGVAESGRRSHRAQRTKSAATTIKNPAVRTFLVFTARRS